MESADIDFGLVRFSSSAVQTITITNLCEVAAVWSLQEARPYNLIDIDKVSVGDIGVDNVPLKRNDLFRIDYKLNL